MSTIAIITIIIVVMIFLSFAMGAFIEAGKGPVDKDERRKEDEEQDAWLNGKKLTEQEKNKNSLDR